MSEKGQRRSLGPPPRWVVSIGASAGGIPPSLAAIFYHLPSWAVVAIALGMPLIGAACYLLIAFADRQTLRAAEVARAFRETAVEEGRRETLRAGLESGDGTVIIKHMDPDVGRWEIKVEAATREQALTPAGPARPTAALLQDGAPAATGRPGRAGEPGLPRRAWG